MRRGTVPRWGLLAALVGLPAGTAFGQGQDDRGQGGEKHETDERGVGETSGQPQDEPGQRSDGRGLAPGGYYGSGAGIPTTGAGGASKGNSGREAKPRGAEDEPPSSDEGSTQKQQR